MENKKVVVTIVILLVLVLGLGGFIAVDKLIINKKSTNKTTQIGDVELDLTVMDHINGTISKLNRAFNDPRSSYYGYLYSKKEINTVNFDKNAALYAAIYENLEGTNTPQLIPGGIVKTNFEDLFGKEIKYEANSIQAGNLYNITYDPSTDNYGYLYLTVYNVYHPRYIIKTIETTAEEGKIIVKQKVLYMEYVIPEAGQQVTQANVYTAKDKNTLVKTVQLKNNTINVDEILGKYGTKIPTYTYTFKEQSNDRYDFYSIAREK